MNNQNTQEITADMIAKEGMLMIKSGRIRNHKLGNTSRIHSGEMEDAEVRIYRDFLPSKNCCIIMELTGDFHA